MDAFVRLPDLASRALVWTLRWWPRCYGRENGRWAGRARC